MSGCKGKDDVREEFMGGKNEEGGEEEEGKEAGEDEEEV